MEILSIYEVTELSKPTKDVIDEIVQGAGQQVIATLRKKYHKFTKFVLKGWYVNTKFVELKIRNRW